MNDVIFLVGSFILLVTMIGGMWIYLSWQPHKHTLKRIRQNRTQRNDAAGRRPHLDLEAPFTTA